MKLKKISGQVVVITGATSGIGLATARLAAKQGAKVVLSARNEDALRKIEAELKAGGAEALAVVADVGNQKEVENVAAMAIDTFGGFDTWVNNAGVSAYGRLEEVPIEDLRRIMDTNLWGVVHGSLAAVKHLKQHGGALINVGSVLSDRAIPLQGMYCASKHAVKGFTDALRMELEEEGSPVVVTLIKPSAINTPYTKHAKNFMETEPKNPAPVYAPGVVARAIIFSAQHPQRDVIVGAGGLALSGLGQTVPRMTDRYMEATMFKGQKSGRPRSNRGDSLHAPSRDGEERGDYRGRELKSSAYTAAKLHPWLTSAAVVATGLAITGVVLAATGKFPTPMHKGRLARLRGHLPELLRPGHWAHAAEDAMDDLDVRGRIHRLREGVEELRGRVM